MLSRLHYNWACSGAICTAGVSLDELGGYNVPCDSHVAVGTDHCPLEEWDADDFTMGKCLLLHARLLCQVHRVEVVELST